MHLGFDRGWGERARAREGSCRRGPSPAMNRVKENRYVYARRSAIPPSFRRIKSLQNYTTVKPSSVRNLLKIKPVTFNAYNYC